MDKFTAIRIFWALGFILFLSGLLNLAFLFRKVWTRPGRLRSVLLKLILSGSTLLFLFFCLEFYFAYFYVRSDISNHTYSSQLWFRKYWKPINNGGYRDGKEKNFEGRKLLYVVGDSFVAGYGVKNTEDRFADLVGRRLGPDWEYVLIARNGWETPDELHAMEHYPVKPDLIVFSYYINDINHAADFRGVVRPQTLRSPSPLLAKLVYKSFFVNWFYWRSARFRVGEQYWNYLKHCYTDPEVWEAHATELDRAVQFARDRNVPICFVVWPNLRRMTDSRLFTDKVTGHLRKQGVIVVDMAEELKGLPGADLVVNSMDGHPNPKTHRRAADLICRALGIPFTP